VPSRAESTAHHREKALPRDSNEALERLAYVEAYWRKIGDGENAWLMLSKSIRSLRGEAMADFRAAWSLV